MASRAWCACLLSAWLAACTPTATTPASPGLPPAAEAPDHAAASTVAAATTATAIEAAATAAPVDPARPAPAEPAPLAAKPAALACATDADCVVKDVGSCCGYRPACVNAQVETHPDEVKARCAAEGRVGACGFVAIESCQCQAGRCAAREPALPGVDGPAPPQVLQ